MTYVSQLQNIIAPNLALDAKVPFLNIRLLNVRVDSRAAPEVMPRKLGLGYVGGVG